MGVWRLGHKEEGKTRRSFRLAQQDVHIPSPGRPGPVDHDDRREVGVSLCNVDLDYSAGRYSASSGTPCPYLNYIKIKI